MKLSICIPTYNRADLLLGTLNLVYASLNNDDIAKEVEVLVGDNQSDDHTSVVCEDFKTYHNFNYIRNASNLGAEGNWLNLVKEASGDFVWILSDDDFFDIALMPKVLQILDSKLAFVYLDYYVESDSTLDVSTSAVDYGKYSKEYKQLIGNGSFEFFTSSKFSNSFISSNIFNRSIFLEKRPLFEEFRGNPWLQLYISKFLLSDDGMFRIIPKSGLVMRGVSLMNSRERAARQGLKHFYYDANLKFLDFYFDMRDSCDTDFGFDYIREDYIQVIYEKHTWRLINNNEDYSYWLGLFLDRSRDSRFNKKIRFYFITSVFLLSPSIVASFAIYSARYLGKLIRWFK